MMVIDFRPLCYSYKDGSMLYVAGEKHEQVFDVACLDGLCSLAHAIRVISVSRLSR